MILVEIVAKIARNPTIKTIQPDVVNIESPLSKLAGLAFFLQG